MNKSDELLRAAERVDWEWVIGHGCTPCFYLEDGKFCLRAMGWDGHDYVHKFTSFADALRPYLGEIDGQQETIDAPKDERAAWRAYVQSYRFALQVIAAGEATNPSRLAQEALRPLPATPQSPLPIPEGWEPGRRATRRATRRVRAPRRIASFIGDPAAKPITLQDETKNAWMIERLNNLADHCAEAVKTDTIVHISPHWANTLRKAAEALAALELQPIATAPHNHRVIVFGTHADDRTEFAMGWLDVCNDKWYYAPQGGLIDQWTPTHWMYVPE